MYRLPDGAILQYTALAILIKLGSSWPLLGVGGWGGGVVCLLKAYSPANRTGSPQVCLLKAYSPANHTGSPQGFYKTCTLHRHKTYTHNPKVSPFGIALIKDGK